MCAITGDHVYFITDVSLQIFAVYFDPIWKPGAVAVESKAVGSLSIMMIMSFQSKEGV